MGKNKSEADATIGFLSKIIIKEMYRHDTFPFRLTPENEQQKPFNVHVLAKKKQVEVRNSCKNC